MSQMLTIPPQALWEEGMQLNPIIQSIAAALGASALLAACGGGGEMSRPATGLSRQIEDGGMASGGDPPAAGQQGGAEDDAKPNTAQGFWTGPASTGYTVSLVVLDDGGAWGVYSSGNTIYGALHGSVKGDGGTLAGSGTDYYFPTDSAVAASVSGTVVEKSGVQARTSTGVTMSLKYSTAYDRPALLENMKGSYAISGRTFEGYFGVNRLTIDASGAFKLVDGGCTATGKVAPRGSKNIFDLNVAFAGATCLVSGSVAGVAYLDTTSKQFVALALNGGGTDGMIVVGSKF